MNDMSSTSPIDDDSAVDGIRRAVFLDRDGVVNQAVVRDGRPYPPRSVDEIVVNEYAAEGLALLKQLGFRLIVVTNQPDVARGLQSRDNVEAIHAWLAARLPIDDFRTCYHDDRDQCDCRKPRPGLLLDAARDYRIDLARSFLVGDRWRDVEAGRGAGCRSIFINYDYAEPRPESTCATVRSFREACDWILQHGKSQVHS